MIIEFKVANYRSINEEQTLSFVADRATRHPDNLIKRPGYRLLKAIGLFGANASGKSNMVKALGAMSAFVRDSATKMNDGDPIMAAEPYLLSLEAQNRPSRFEITFIIDNTVYIYGFAVDRDRVHEEWLSTRPETSEKEFFGFHRQYDPHNGTYSCEAKVFTTTFPLLVLEWTRDNALSLSVGAQRNFQQLLPVYRYLRGSIQTYDASSEVDELIAFTAERCQEDETFQQQVESLLRDADTGVESLSIEHQKTHDLPRVDYRLPKSIEAFYKILNEENRTHSTQQILTRRHGNGGAMVEFNFRQNDSNGTQHLFGLAGVFLSTLISGTFLVIDELDASMHPLLTYRLLEMFQRSGANPNTAQLLFTTHDPSLLDQELFRRDQIWLAEKWEGVSTFFSLADIEPPIRSTESFFRNYLTGRYGGTPHLGPAFDMVETGNKA